MGYRQDLEVLQNVMYEVYENSPYSRNGNDYSARVVTREKFVNKIEKSGFVVGKPYHANGIGNNNECAISKRIKIQDGYEIDVPIGSFYYTYGIYGKRAYVGLKDRDDNTIFKFNDNEIFYE